MHYRDIPMADWPRRPAFEHFRTMRQPAFSVTVPVDVTGLRERALQHGATPWLAYHHAALEAANAVDEMRQTFTPDGQGVREYAEVHTSTTVLRDDGSFGFLTMKRDASLARFAADAKPRLVRVKQSRGEMFATGGCEGVVEAQLIHTTALPWMAFTAFTHARNAGDDRPKVAFGRFMAQGERLLMPVAVDVHHALCDGVHVGRFFERLQAALDAV